MNVTVGKTHDIAPARTLQLPASSIVVFDRAYTDYSWFKSLNDKDISFVTRQKKNARHRVAERRPAARDKGVTSDQTIYLTGASKARNCPIPLRRVGFMDPETRKHYDFLTNNFELDAETIAAIYKARWDIEMFFKWIKQNLKVKTFVGTSRNAVLTQLWIAACIYLLMACLKYCSKVDISLGKIARLFHTNLFERRDLTELMKGKPPDLHVPSTQAVLRLV